MGTTLISIARFLCGLIDSIVYKVISKIYDLFFDVANVILYSEEAVDAIGQRIALILGIFMLFRIAVSLISYLISPDKLSDNSKGGAKLITNVIVSLVLLSTINIIFVEAYKIQIKIVDSKIIEKIFFGKKATVENVDIAYILYSSFVTPTDPKCIDLFDPYKEPSDECSSALTAAIKNQDVIDIINNDVLRDHKIDRLLSNYDTINYKNLDVYVFDYLPIISTVSGVIVVLILISFCMELALRAVKLLFLQIIAPIPIIANIDPGKGSEVFKKWSKETINTYISIFIRIIIINFAIFMITLVKNEFYTMFEGKSVFLTIILVIGCLMFAKQVPKLIEDMLGIKLDGMTLKPIKKFQEQTLGGKAITGTAKKALGATTGLAVGTMAGAAGLATGQGPHRAYLSKAVIGGWKGDKLGKNFMTAYNAGKLRHKELQEMDADGISRGDVLGANIRETFGAESNATKVQRLVNQAKSIQTSFDTIKQQLVACDMDDSADLVYKGKSYNRSSKTIAKELDELKKTTVEKQAYRDQAIEALKRAKVQAAIDDIQRKSGRTLKTDEIDRLKQMIDKESLNEEAIQNRMEALYDKAVTAQKQKIADTEKELEGRINAAVAGIKEGNAKTASIAASARKIVKEQADRIVSLKDKTNKLGLSLDEKYEGIKDVDDSDIVMIMKKAKGIEPQTRSGVLEKYSDIGKYTKKGNK